MGLGIAEPAALTAPFAAFFVRTAATRETAVVVAFPTHRPPAVAVVFVIVATARARSAFTHKATFIVAIAPHGPEGSGAIVLVVALEAVARISKVAREA